MPQEKRRLPARQVEIAKIRGDEFRVRVLGTIVDRDESSGTALIDDGTGRAVLLFADPELFERAREGARVRVIGRVRLAEAVEIEVEVMQDMSRLDMNLYEQVKYAVEKLKEERG
ncbi:MAG: hypothetical protein GXO66_08215 [Euryarchaeota archaeon]|nr:hypothetical protein [Euryarchaeota archaeon]